MLANKSIWESYEELSPLVKIEINFCVLIIILCLIFGVDRWIKNRALAFKASDAKPDMPTPVSSLIKQQANGVTCIYIAWWRYALLAMAFSAMLYVLGTAC